MKRMMLALALGTTLAGCAGSEGDQNYKVLEEDAPRYQEQRGEAALVVTAVVAQADTAPAAAPARGPAAADITSDTPANAVSLDRSNWPAVEVSQVDGRVTHYPHDYFRDLNLRPLPPYKTLHKEVVAQFKGSKGVQTVTLDRLPSVEDQMNAAMDLGPETITEQNAVELFAQPLKMAGDMIVSPVKMYQTPPWTKVQTPE